MVDKNSRFPLKEAGKSAEFNRWLVGLVLKVTAVAVAAGMVLYLLSLSFEKQRELLRMDLSSLQKKFDTSLAAQKASLDTSLHKQVAILSTAVTEQQKSLERALGGQAANQQKLERARLVSLLKQIRGECSANCQRLTAETGSGFPGMKLQLELKDETVLTSYSPDVRFKTTMWDIANTKDYFIAHRSLSTDNLAAVYEMFSRFNSFADEFNGQVLLMRSMASKEGYASLEFKNTLRFANNLKEAANELVDSLAVARGDCDERLRREIQALEPARRSATR